MIFVFHNDVAHKVPCGKCAFCLQNKRSSWMFRIFHEMRIQDRPSWFLTLTYDQKHVKRVGDKLSLRFRDVQLFLKRVRKGKYYAKYICVGEYGPTTGRPHYHVIIWTDCPANELESFWGRGNIHFGKLNMASAMYTLKYIIQPKPPKYEGVEVPRAQFSRGIGLGYLTNAVYDFHTWNEDEPKFYSFIGDQKVALPKYYRDKIFTKYQIRKNGQKVKWEAIRERRKLMRELLSQGLSDTKHYIDRIRADEGRMILEKTKFNLSL